MMQLNLDVICDRILRSDLDGIFDDATTRLHLLVASGGKILKIQPEMLPADHI